MATAKRIYLTTIKAAPGQGADVERLVRAASQAQAAGHITRSLVTAKVAEQDDLVRLASAGVKVEDAGEAPAGEPAHT